MIVTLKLQTAVMTLQTPYFCGVATRQRGEKVSLLVREHAKGKDTKASVLSKRTKSISLQKSVADSAIEKKRRW